MNFATPTNELHLQHRKVLASPGSRAAYAPMAAYREPAVGGQPLASNSVQSRQAAPASAHGLNDCASAVSESDLGDGPIDERELRRPVADVDVVKDWTGEVA